jgi:hypothetical protein
METCDSLFFLQLLLPIADPKQSGIPDDPREAFYSKGSRFSNLYKFQADVGTGYGHNIKDIQQHEYVRFDGCLV